mgnify:CR=1 FL=1
MADEADKKEEVLTTIGTFKELVDTLSGDDESPADKNQRGYGRTNIMKGKRQASIPESGSPQTVRAVEGTDQQSLYNTMFGHIFRKYRTLV